jgi:dihydrofolate synthase/folylpolyglutamate synthase
LESYQESLEWLYSQVSNYQRVGIEAYKPGFDNILKLCEILDNPQNHFKSVHVAGTNGKGSTSNMTASVLKEAGYKTGLYTSPHLVNFTERIRVDGKECPPEFVQDFLTRVRVHFSLDFNPSFFELTTAMAFDYFARRNVDIAVIEVGLGGRLDSTNIITPEVSAITGISLDHTELLGDTLEKIAWEKAGIIKTGVPVVIREEKTDIKNILIQIAEERGSDFIDATKIKTGYQSDLQGIYQKKNIKSTLGIIQILRKKGFDISEESLKRGLLHVAENMNFRGRWEILQKENPMIVCDTAHNEDGFRQLQKQFKKLKYNQLHIVIGFVQGKNLDPIFTLLPPDAVYYFVKPSIPRGLSPDDYEEKIRRYFKKYKKINSVAEGFEQAKSSANQQDIIFIGGSNFVVSEVF